MNLQRLAGILDTKDKKRSVLFAFYVRLTDVSVKGLPAKLFKGVFILLLSAEHKRYQTQEVIRIDWKKSNSTVQFRISIYSEIFCMVDKDWKMPVNAQ